MSLLITTFAMIISISNVFSITINSEDNKTEYTTETTYFEVDGGLIPMTQEVETVEQEVIETYENVNTFARSSRTLSTGPRLASFTNVSKIPTVQVYPTFSGGSRITYVQNDSNSGVFPILDEVGSRYKVAISGVIGWVDMSEITNITTFNSSSSYNYYSINKDNELVHNVSKDQTGTQYYAGYIQGDAPKYLSVGAKYISFDGRYFYPASLSGMNALVSDYNNSTRKNSINPSEPYINYFQWLPARAQSKLTAADLNKYLSTTATKAIDSKLVQTEQLFIDQGNFYGLNPALGFATAIHESGFGKSSIAREKNNFFGHAAYDSNVGLATSYITPNFGLENHFSRFLNAGYLHEKDWRNRGGMVGNKGVGMNVFYASDPFWGEKIAQHYYKMDKLAGQKDYKRYSIGVFKTAAVNIRPEANSNDTPVYMNRVLGSPIAILETKTGSSLSGNTTWYGFNTDSMLGSDKKVLSVAEINKKEYNFLKDKVAYVHSSTIDIVSQGKESASLPQTKPTLRPHYKVSSETKDLVLPMDLSFRPDPSTNYTSIDTLPKGTTVKGNLSANGWYLITAKTSNGLNHIGYIDGNVLGEFIPGDVNGDRKLNSLDYSIIKDYIMSKRTLTEEELTRADITGDGKVKSNDYMAIKTIIMER